MGSTIFRILETIPSLTVKSGERINFYLAAFVSKAENDYKLEHGAEKLYELFESAALTPVVDLFRESLI